MGTGGYGCLVVVLMATVGCGDDDDDGGAVGADARVAFDAVAVADGPIPDGPIPDGPTPDAPLPIDCTGVSEPVLGSTGGFSGIRVHADDPLMVGVGSIVGDGAGALWGQDPVGNGTSGDRVIAIGTDGGVTTLAAPASMSTCVVTQIARAPSGNLYLYDITPNRLRQITPAGVATEFSTVGNVGGGGSCTNTGVIGAFALADGSFVLGSPAAGKLFHLTSDGVTRTDVADVVGAFRVEGDGGDGFYVVQADGALVHVDGAGAVSTVLDASLSVRSVRRDDDGTLYFVAGRTVYRTDSAGADVREVASCFPGAVTDLELDAPSDGSGPTSLYVVNIGAGIDANDGDAIHEITR